MARGDEILIADPNPRDRGGLKKLFEQEGYVCTTVEQASEARDLVVRKFFPAAIIDLDVDQPNGGLELVRFVQEHSKPTSVVMTTGRRSFDGAVAALRLGVLDVIMKRREAIDQLKASVHVAVDRYRATDSDSALINEVRGVLDEGFRIMLHMGRQLYEGSSSSASQSAMTRPSLLIIDHDQGFLQQLSQLLADRPWDIAVELSGGSGLDKASTFPFQLVAARQELPDLPGAMLIKSLQMQQPRVLGMVYTADPPPGRVERYQHGRVTHVERPFAKPEDLVARLGELVGEFASLQKERKYIQAFRSRHGEFLKRYADLKARLDALHE